MKKFYFVFGDCGVNMTSVSYEFANVKEALDFFYGKHPRERMINWVEDETYRELEEDLGVKKAAIEPEEWEALIKSYGAHKIGNLADEWSLWEVDYPEPLAKRGIMRKILSAFRL